MPHLIVEHSHELTNEHDMARLAHLLSDSMRDTHLFPLAGIRVRMHPVDIYAMADGHKDNRFVAVILRVGAGRALKVRQQAGQAAYDCLCGFFAKEIEAGFMAVSVDMEINDPDMSFKRNGVADRLN